MTTRIRSAFAASTGFVAAVTPPKSQAGKAQAENARTLSPRAVPLPAASALREAA